MKKLEKILLLIFLIIFILGLFILHNFYFQERKLGNNVMSDQEFNELKKTHEEYHSDVALYYNGEVIPYSYSDNFYLLNIKNEKDYKKIYSISNFKIKLLDKENNYMLRLVLYNDKYYKDVYIELTNIPVISINDDDLYLYGFNNLLNKLKCTYGIRGGSSTSSDKKSYKLKLFDSKNNVLNLPLLGMNEASEWVLNPIYFDNSYIREKLSFDIWNSLSDQYNHNLEYVELFINNEYQGLYYLEEKVTLATFNGDETKDLLAFIKNWHDDFETADLNDLFLTNNKIIDEFEIEEGLENNLELQKRLVNSFEMSLKGTKTNIPLVYNLKNMVDYGLLINITMAGDNRYKNQKVLFRSVDDYYYIEKTIWDLDWTFGNENIIKSFPTADVDISNIIVDLGIPKSVLEDPLYISYSKNKYLEFREDYFNEKNLFNIINDYNFYLEKYGAISRDSLKWKKDNHSSSVSIIKDFIQERIKVLDEYYGGL